MKTEKIRESILGGKTSLGIELGSTRIKGILVDENNEVIASGGYSWENRLENGIWTYHLNDVWTGMRECYRTLADDVKEKYDKYKNGNKEKITLIASLLLSKDNDEKKVIIESLFSGKIKDIFSHYFL